ncbi:MAG TPA: inner membrane-spanning protein YciB [Nevskiaceae bacterium]|nr:inner membrane-spanning protein YciB [Nevskiaceae bacterium]
MNLLLNYGPAFAFLGAYLAGGIYLATEVLIASLILVVLLYRLWKGVWHNMHMAVALIAAVLGGLTLYLHDPTFIKYKPSAVYGVFALALLTSQFVGDKVLLARIPQHTITLPDALWRKVNLAWALFFMFCAALNIYVAFHFDEATWVKFKAFGFTALMFVFLLAHLPFVWRHLPQEP